MLALDLLFPLCSWIRAGVQYLLLYAVLNIGLKYTTLEIYICKKKNNISKGKFGEGKGSDTLPWKIETCFNELLLTHLKYGSGLGQCENNSMKFFFNNSCNIGVALENFQWTNSNLLIHSLNKQRKISFSNFYKRLEPPGFGS